VKSLLTPWDFKRRAASQPPCIACGSPRASASWLPAVTLLSDIRPRLYLSPGLPRPETGWFVGRNLGFLGAYASGETGPQ
jgi:hypothetical protein